MASYTDGRNLWTYRRDVEGRLQRTRLELFLFLSFPLRPLCVTLSSPSTLSPLCLGRMGVFVSALPVRPLGVRQMVVFTLSLSFLRELVRLPVAAFM